jgi:hypothetical protein
MMLWLLEGIVTIAVAALLAWIVSKAINLLTGDD